MKKVIILLCMVVVICIACLYGYGEISANKTVADMALDTQELMILINLILSKRIIKSRASDIKKEKCLQYKGKCANMIFVVGDRGMDKRFPHILYKRSMAP